MQRLLILLCVVLFLAALPMSHLAFAGKPEEKPAKVKVCHVTGQTPYEDARGNLRQPGHVIEVSENAFCAHIRHGDLPRPNKNVGDECGVRLDRQHPNCYEDLGCGCEVPRP
jgi:hypothetical protein